MGLLTGMVRRQQADMSGDLLNSPGCILAAGGGIVIAGPAARACRRKGLAVPRLAGGLGLEDVETLAWAPLCACKKPF